MSNLVVMFPGLGYTNDKPLLYYGKKLANAAGYDDCHPVKFGVVNKTGLQGNPEKMMEVYKRLYKTAVKSLAEIEWTKYDKILFISKSIGTVVAASYENELTESWKNDPTKKEILPPIKQILFTPLEQTFMFHPSNAIGFIGTNDPWCNPREVVNLANKQYIPINVYEKANHSLETGDVTTDIENLKNVMDICKKFLL
ncbi:MAG: alpha/beta hydrolase [Lachnospiraceae bacterium]|nr:alpha/beta hydrolase [Lachnospiraceae bacterium]